MFTADIDLSEIQAAWAKGCDELGKDLETSSVLAAKDGVEEAREHHTYQDRTGNLTSSAHADPQAVGALMRWPMDYSSYVNFGTRRSRAFDFLTGAVNAATRSLEIRALFDAETLCEKMNKT